MKGNDIAEWLHSGSLISTHDGNLLLGWGKRQWRGGPKDTDSRPLFYFPDFFLEEKSPWFEQEHTEIVTPQALLELLPIASFPSLPVSWQRPCRSSFEETLIQLQNKFSRGELAKAVPFVIETTPSTMTQERLLRSLKSLLLYVQRSTAHAYGFWDADGGILGATPEVLFQMTSTHSLLTMACAGTGTASGEETDLLHDPKELHEHQIVVQGIAESLSPFGKVVLGGIELLRLPSLTHLKTPIYVELNGIPDIEEILHALHPTPALGAFPRKAGAQWLHEYRKKIDRKRYGAPVGYLMPKMGEPQSVPCAAYVAIRNVQWNRRQMHVAAGCGIVPTSQAKKEWDEINLKLDAIKEMLSL